MHLIRTTRLRFSVAKFGNSGNESLCKIGIDVDTYPHVFKKTVTWNN